MKLLRSTSLALFLGWLIVWILVPTKVFKNKWTPHLAKELSTTYFGKQGINLVLLTVPMMLIAVLSCVYLHLQKISKKPKISKGVTKRSRLGMTSRPVLVMAPLGIVTALELIFSVMFVGLVSWSLGNYLYVSFGKLHRHGHGETVSQAKFRSVSLRLGYVGNICWAFLFFPVTRGSSILGLVGLTSESSIKYHIWLGHLSNFLFLLHTLGFLIYWAMLHQLSEAIAWSKTYVSNLAGTIAMVIGIVMWVTSLPKFRRKMFEVFFYTHHLYGLYILFYVLHVGDDWFCMILPNIFLFFIDRYLRFLQSRQSSRVSSARLLPCGAIELAFSKTPGLHYNPTSILFINVPSISKLQWHPFTVTSNCNLESESLSIVIKCGGSWTQKLYQQISSSPDRLEVSTDGPYGPNSFGFLRHEQLIMVSGGSGITPFISIIREILFQSQDQDFKLPKVVLICAFKNYSDLAMLDLLLPISGTSASQISKLVLTIQVHITRENEQPKTDTNKLLQTIWFKSNPLDSAISPVLGPNNWLWLGVIIVSSFFMFLLFLGLVTRYYIYPVDHGTGVIYHFSYRALWNMFLGCVCICIASSAVFLWRKKQNGGAKEKQVENMERQTPALSPGSWFVSGERELESLPNQSLVENTIFHFGARPNLKKKLFEYDGSTDVGVLVCGPKNMRHEVARICSSGLAENLHFESISFNW